ncbi:MAG: hypothetical protein U0746_19515 [Gemmataceae bacterium]
MADATTSTTPARGRRSRFRWLAWTLLSIAAVYAMIFATLEWRARQAWAEACAEADQLDPGWRWEDMTAKLPTAGDTQRVADLARLIDSRDGVGRSILAQETPVPRRLPPDVLARLRAAIEGFPPPAEAEALFDGPGAYIPLPASPLLHNKAPAVFPYLTIAKGLFVSASAVRADDGDADAALASVRGMVAASRPPMEYPGLLHNLVAGAIQVLAVRSLERTLAHGEPSSAALEATRRCLDAEAGRTHLLSAFRSERAFVDDTIRAMADGRLARRDVVAAGMFADPVRTPWPAADRWVSWLLGRDLNRSNAVALLRHHTWVVERLKESPDSLTKHDAEWVALRATMTGGARSVADNIARAALEMNDIRALVRCAVAALAVEQFRRDAGRWPAALDELVPRYLAAVPADPFDLAPLRLVRRPDGIVIYSIGPNGKDDGGAVAGDGVPRPTDHGVRLWDVAQRRQPPATPRAGRKEP